MTYLEKLLMKVRNAYDAFDDRYYDDGTGQGWTQMTSSGQPMDPEQAMRESTVFACIRLLSDTLAMLPLVLYKYQKDGDKIPDISNPLFRVLRYAPNYRDTSFTQVKFNMMSMLLRGYFLSKKYTQSGTGKVIALEQCHPDHTRFKMTDSGKLEWSTVLCRDVAAGRAGRKFTLKWEDAYYCPYATIDGILPISPIAWNYETVGFAKEMREHGATQFKNNAMPSGVLEVQNKLKDDGYKNMKESWHENYGNGNRGKIAILEQGTKFTKISMSNQDAQYLETRQYTKEEICGIFGVPTHLISDTKRAKGWSTTEQQMLEYLIFSGSPYMRRFEDSIRMTLIPDYQWGKVEAKFDTKELLKTDGLTRAKRNEIYIKNGVINPNEARLTEDMNSREGGDDYFDPGAATETSQDDENDEDKGKEDNEEVEENDE